MSSISSFLKFLNYFWGPTNFLLLTKPISNISFLPIFQEPVCYVTLHDCEKLGCTEIAQSTVKDESFDIHF